MIVIYSVTGRTLNEQKQKAQQLMGWPHQRENAVSDRVVSRDLDFEGLLIRIWL
jgi:hypothetical protein